MKQKLSPNVAAIVIIVAIAVVALTWTRFGRVSQGDPKTAVSGMPPEAQAEFQKRLGAGSQTAGGGTPPTPASCRNPAWAGTCSGAKRKKEVAGAFYLIVNDPAVPSRCAIWQPPQVD